MDVSKVVSNIVLGGEGSKEGLSKIVSFSALGWNSYTMAASKLVGFPILGWQRVTTQASKLVGFMVAGFSGGKQNAAKVVAFMVMTPDAGPPPPPPPPPPIPTTKAGSFFFMLPRGKMKEITVEAVPVVQAPIQFTVSNFTWHPGSGQASYTVEIPFALAAEADFNVQYTTVGSTAFDATLVNSQTIMPGDLGGTYTISHPGMETPGATFHLTLQTISDSEAGALLKLGSRTTAVITVV